MGFISFGGAIFLFGGLKPPKPMPGYVPVATVPSPEGRRLLLWIPETKPRNIYFILNLQTRLVCPRKGQIEFIRLALQIAVYSAGIRYN